MRHTCHWPGCDKTIQPRLFMCAPHWRQLPQAVRNQIWHEYRPGQEITLDLSREYLAAVRAALDWADEVEKHRRGTLL